MLDHPYTQYQMKADLGLYDITEIEADFAKSPMREAILEGRKALGEREDFEF